MYTLLVQIYTKETFHILLGIHVFTSRYLVERFLYSFIEHMILGKELVVQFLDGTENFR